jgi:hypothetical protein
MSLGGEVYGIPIIVVIAASKMLLTPVQNFTHGCRTVILPLSRRNLHR